VTDTRPGRLPASGHRPGRPGPFFARDRGHHPPALWPDYKTSVARSPRQPLLSFENTLSEITGPLFSLRDLGPQDNDLLSNFATEGQPIGERMLLHGQVLDQNARPVPGVLIEIWQANAAGRYRHVNDGYRAPLDPAFGGCGRTVTDSEGRYFFRSIKPGAYPWPNATDSWRPAHVHFSIFGSGFAQRLITQAYFEGDPLIDRCPIAGSIPDPAARNMLVARLDMENSVPFDMLAWRFDIVLRGRRSTCFENRPEGN